jgi:hypothetical protein
MGLMRLNKYGFVGISHAETTGVGTVPYRTVQLDFIEAGYTKA